MGGETAEKDFCFPLLVPQFIVLLLDLTLVDIYLIASPQLDSYYLSFSKFLFGVQRVSMVDFIGCVGNPFKEDYLVQLNEIHIICTLMETLVTHRNRITHKRACHPCIGTMLIFSE